ncbi:MAG: tRNA pseudouridine(55) synthase TruB [Rickettsiales bacterium]|nr:tRNA pseudouridine(55) synthase TruB [Rickettsiales bacterium]
MGRRRRTGKVDKLLQGVLLVDKPAGMTSHDVCQRIRSRLRLGKVGHGGTLDPFATGLLPLLLNGTTRLMPQLQNQDKGYEARVRLGQRTDTMDPTGAFTMETDASVLSDDEIRAAIAAFEGEYEQTVPRYAAARVDGKRLYEYARAGEEVQLPTKLVVVSSIETLGIERSGTTVDVLVRLDCGAGTYVRAIADDLGQALGVGGHLLSLRRTRTGMLRVDEACTVDRICDESERWREERAALQADGGRLPFVAATNAARWRAFLGEALIPVAQLLGGVPTLRVSAPLAQRIRSGEHLRKADLATLVGAVPEAFMEGDPMVVEDPEGATVVAVVRAACASASLGRRKPGSVVFQVDRILR